MSIIDYILMAISCTGMVIIIITIVSAYVTVTWWEATEGSDCHESAQR